MNKDYNKNMIEYYNLYYSIINSISKISNKDLNTSLLNLKLYYLASTLKIKFQDKRSVKELYQLIIKEYGIK